MKLTNLKTLSMDKPIGIDKVPYFSWMLESDIPDTMQKSYRLTLTDESGELCYDTGVVESDRNSYLRYAGPALKSRTIYQWTIHVTDNHGNEATATSSFETALPRSNGWDAQWARSPLRKKKGKAGFGLQDPATMFRQDFTLKAEPVRVRVYATCHGVYELYINGTRPDNLISSKKCDITPARGPVKQNSCFFLFINIGKYLIRVYCAFT